MRVHAWCMAMMVVAAAALGCSGGCRGGSSKARPLAQPASESSTPSSPPAAPDLSTPLAAERAQPLPSNVRSPLGTNLAEISYDSRDWPFANRFKHADPWASKTGDKWHDGRPLTLSPEGWVTGLLPDQTAVTLVPTWAGGPLIVTWRGTGVLQVRGGEVVSEAAHRVEIKTGRDATIILEVLRTDAGDPIRDIVVVEKALEGTRQLFHPLFLEKLAPFAVLRFMDWGRTNNNSVSRWSERTLPTAATQAHPQGVAYEHMLALSNQLGADPWLCVPHKADDAFVRSLAELVRDQLDKNRRVYVEYSNEVWNDVFEQAAYARAESRRLRLATDDHEGRLLFQAQRSRQIFDLFTEVLGAARVVRVMGSQQGNTWAHEVLLRDAEVAARTDALAIAPYFGGEAGEVERAAALRAGPQALLDTLEKTSLPQTLGWIKQSADMAKKLGKPLIAYEGGQHLVLHPSIHGDDVLNAVLDAANRDRRMGVLYRRLLDGWRDAGGQLFVAFTFAQAPNRYGRWGALEHLDDDRAAAPKWDALLQFTADQPRWW